jgi:ribosome-binding factor A
MAPRRLERLNAQLKREIAVLLRTDVRDPRIDAVTVTAVDAARDLTTAKVFVHLWGPDEERAQSMEGLEAAAPFLRGTLGRRLHVRRVPELHFMEDRSEARARRIEEILSEVDIPEPEDEASEDDGGDGPKDDEL